MKTPLQLRLLLSIIIGGLFIGLLSSFSTYKSNVKAPVPFYLKPQHDFLYRLIHSHKLPPPPPSFTTKDTVFSYGTGTWKATFRVTDNLYATNGADSGQCIIFFPGSGEAGNGYGTSGLAKFGPLDYVSVGWDGGVVLGNGTHYPIIVCVEQIGDFPYNVKDRIGAVVTSINSRFRIKKKNGTPCIHLTGLSAGGYTAQVMVMSDPYSTTGPWPNASKVRSICNVQGVKPNDYPDYPITIQNFSRAGGRMASFEGSLDGRDMATVINSMNSAVASSGILTTLTGIMSTHCCWNYFYGGDGNGTTYSTPTTYLLDGIVQSGYQWMLRQGDTSIGSSGNPSASAGGNQNLFYPVNTTFSLNGKASADDGTIVSYAWTKLSGPSCTITSPSADSTGVTITSGGTYVFQLLVTDNLGNTGTDQATIYVSAPPIVNAGVDQTITSPTSSITMAASATDEGSISRNLLSKFFAPGQPVTRVAFGGSSTCFGYGVPFDSGWVYRTWHYWKSLGLVDTCYNLGVTSTDIYMFRPTGSTLVANRSAPDPTLNINAACAKPGVKLVIVNYNNGYDFMSASEVMNVMREIKAYAAALPTPITVWVTTAQPRSGYSASEQLNLKIISDSTKLAFPTTYLDFYYPLIVPGTTTRRPQFELGDGVHNNSNGHAQLYKEAVGFNPLQSLVTSSAVITTPTSLTSTVTGLGLGSRAIMVACIDNDSLMNHDYMLINVNPSAGAVQANAGADINITMPITTAQLNGSSSSGSGITYSWIKIDSPANSKAQEGVIASPTSAITNVTNVGYGTYKYKLTVTNGGTPSTDTVLIIGNRQKSRIPSALPPVRYSLVPNGGEYYYTNILNNIPGLKGGDTLYLTQSAGTCQFYGAGPDGGWGGDSTMKLAIRAAPGVVIGAAMRIDGQYIDIKGITFIDNGNRRAGIVLGNKHSNVEVSNCYMTGGENFIYDKTPVDSLDVLTYGDSWRMNDDYLHDNYTIDSKGEAYYLGHTFTFDGTQPAQGYIPTKLYNCIVTHDTVINATWDGIQTSNGVNYTITHNYVSGTGLDSISSQGFGVILGGYTTGRADSNYIKLAWSSGIAAFGYDTMRITGNTIDTCGFYDVITRNPFVYNPFTSIYINDNIVSWIGTPSPTLAAKVTGNCINHVSTYTGGAAVKNANGGGTSRAGIISGNTVYDAAGRLLTNLIISNVSGETISGNTLGSCNSGNVNPFVDAGPDVNITVSATTAILNGNATDIDGFIVSYLWTQVSGPNTASITSPTTASTGLTGLTQGTYVFRLTATDNQGASVSNDVSLVLRVQTGKKAIGQKNVYF